jgi:hypothetical protein
MKLNWYGIISPRRIDEKYSDFCCVSGLLYDAVLNPNFHKNTSVNSA